MYPNVFVFPKPAPVAATPAKTYPGYNPYRRPATGSNKPYCPVCQTTHAFSPEGAVAARHRSQLWRVPSSAVAAWNAAKADAGVR